MFEYVRRFVVTITLASACAGIAVAQDEPAPEATTKPKASAEEIQALFDQLFAPEIKLVKATPDTADDAALAERLMEATASTGEQQELVALLCENAYELASRDASALDTAARALGMLTGLRPQKSAEYSEQLLNIRQRQFNVARGEDRAKYGQLYIDDLARAADNQAEDGDVADAIVKYRMAVRTASLINSPSKNELTNRITDLNTLQNLYRRVDMLKEKIKRDPKDKDAANQLLMLYVVELDRPAEARKFTFLIDDTQLKDNIRNAASEPDKITPEAALNLGEWYRTLAAEARTPATRAAMFNHAAQNYQRYVDSGEGDALMQTKAKLGLKMVEDQLETINARLAEQNAAAGGETAVGAGDSPKGAKMVFDPGYYIDDMVIFLQRNGRVVNDAGKVIGRWSQKRHTFHLQVTTAAMTWTYASYKPKNDTIKTFYFDHRNGEFTAADYYVSLTKSAD